MSDMAYIMETQDPRELWLVDGEQRMRVSRDMYWLLVSQGADLPPLHDISDLLAENAALRQQVADVTESMGRVEELCAKLRELGEQYEVVVADYRSEIVKLRELCKTLHRLADESYVPFEDVNPWVDDFAKATCAMRELGIEVD